MPMHPLLRTLTGHPEWLAEHGAAYAALAAAEARAALVQAQRRAALAVLAMACGVAALLLAGMAGLLAAALPLASMPAPWALVAVPAGLAALGGVLWWRQQALPMDLSLPVLRAQWSQDRALMARAAEPA